MKKLKSLLKNLNLLIINLTILSLIQNPLINANLALAADNPASGGSGGSGGSSRITADDVKSVSNILLGTAKMYFDEKQKIVQMQIAAANNQRMMAQFGPNCRNPNGTPCFATSAKYFPECTLPASMSNMPQNVCSNATPDVTQISNMITFEAIAQGWSNYYEQMMNKASNATIPTGLRCLEDKQKAIDSSLIEMVNSLQRLQDRLNQDKQVFRDNNKKLLEDMNSANDELFGTNNGKGDLKNKTSDMSKLFSPACQTVIGKEFLSQAKANGGLNGILQNVSPMSRAAGDFSQNRAVIENDIRQEANKIASTISKNGVGDFITNGYIPQSEEAQKSFGNAIKIQIMKQAKEFETAKKRIDSTLAEVGYTAPALSSNFSVDLDEFIAGSNDFFKKKYINECVTGADRGIAIPVDQILKSLQQKSTNSEGTARNDYREALKKILDSDAMIQDKMDRIKALESGYPDITVTYKDFNQQRRTVSPYSLFMETISKCESAYSQGDQFTNSGTKGGNSVSFQKKVDRARAALQELKSLNDSYSSKVTSSILSQVLDCGGSGAKAGKCSTETLDSSKDNFCVSHASECANQIQGCYAEAEKHVQTRKTKMENLAKVFNANVAAMIAKSNSYYEQQKAAVTSMTKLIQSKFPGTNFEIPKDMFVTMPELKKDTFGVELAADGNLKDILDGEGSMPKRIEALKTMFKNQKEAVDKEVADYIRLQESAMEKQKGRWEKLASECKNMVNASSAELAKMNAEGQKKQAEQDSNVANFCRKYNNIAQNPLGACGKAQDLAGNMDSIVGNINQEAANLTTQWANACDGYMNEKDNSSGGSTDNCKDISDAKAQKDCYAVLARNSSNQTQNQIKIGEICSNSTDDKSFINKIVSKYFTAADREKLKDKTTIDDLIKKIEADKIEDRNFFSQIKDFTDGDIGGKTSLCQKLLYKGGNRDCSKCTQEQKADLEQGKKDLTDILASLNRVGGSTTDNSSTSSGGYKAEVNRIGQQMKGACEANNNSNINGKSLGSLFDTSGFDQSILNAGKAK